MFFCPTLFHTLPRAKSGKNRMQMLIIRPGAVGDTLLTFPVLQALRAKYADSSITFVGNASVLPLALAAGLVDAVSDYQSLQWSDLFSPAGITTPSLRELLQSIDLAVCWLRDSDGLVARNLYRVGVKQCVIAPGRPPEGERLHVVTYLARTLGVNLESLSAFHLALPSMEGADVEPGSTAIHPGSGGARKCWPVSHFASVIERLWEAHHPVLLLAGPADAESVLSLQQHLAPPPEPALLKLLVDAPLLEVARALKGCKGYLGNDSGVTHLAAMLGVPTVALFGPSDPTIWRPIGSRVHIIKAVRLEELAPDVVMSAARSVILAAASP